MSTLREAAPHATRAAGADCWNKVGVRGDFSCPQLKQHVHCRNCPVYSAAATHLLDADPPSGYLAHWTQQVAQRSALAELTTHSVVVFRVGGEWLALATAVLIEVVSVRAVHTLPHRRNGVVLGLANIRGELLVCFSLQHILGLEEAEESHREKQRAVTGRFLVIERDGSRAACPVEEVYGIAHFHRGEITSPPTTITKAAAAYTRSVLSWQKGSIGLLDDQLLFHTVNRNLA